MSTCTVIELAAAAIAAYRINQDQVIKENHTEYDEDAGQPVILKEANKHIMSRLLTTDSAQITDGDREHAQQAMDDVLGDHTIKLLGNRRISGFEFSLVELLQSEGQIKVSRHAGLMAFLPSSHAFLIRNRARQDAALEASGSKWLGREKDRVQLDFVPTDSRYMADFDSWRVNGMDPNGNMVTFWTRHKALAEAGRIHGRIRRLDRHHLNASAQVTVLNYVKRV